MRIDLETPILEKNDKIAAENRKLLDEHGIYVIDLLSSPGSGKTSTILSTIAALRDRYSFAVIEGDIASDVDAEKIKEVGVPAVQVNTGGACHLESNMVKRALSVLDLDAIDILIIENVGNLVCPTDFYLGEDRKVMILSVPEGDDKPLKYPGVFQVSKAIILNKVDVLPVFDFDKEAFVSNVRRVNPKAPIFPISAVKGDGVDAWASWLADSVEDFRKDLGCGSRPVPRSTSGEGRKA